MPIVTLKFKLPDEEKEFRVATQGAEFKAVLWDVDQYLRAKIKHGYDLSEEKREAYKEIRTLIHTELTDRNVSLDD